MFKKKKLNFRIKATMVLLMILMTTVYMNFLTNNSNNTVNSEKIDDEPDDPLNPFKTPKVSTIKFDQWWNTSFAYRRLINVTNNHDVNLTDAWTLIQFNYADLVAAGYLNESLKDVRIIENDIEREYYIEKDYPSTNLATVYFRNNCTNNTIEMDTYLYYGNNSVNHGFTLVNYNPYGINWYRFEEGSGNDINNELERYDGRRSYSGAEQPTWKSTAIDDPEVLGDNYLEFDGNDYIFIKDQHYTEENYFPRITMSCWFRTSYPLNPGDRSDYSPDNWAFFDFDRSENFNFYHRAYDGGIGFSTSAAGSPDTRDDMRSNTKDLNNGSWIYAIVIYDGSEKEIYINDISSPDKRTTNTPHNDLALGRWSDRPKSGDYDRYGFIGDGSEAYSEDGARNGGNIGYVGDLDEVRFWNWSLDQYEREQVKNGYLLETALNDPHANTANIEVTAIGLDGEDIPDVTISINQTSSGSYIKRQKTGSDGTTIFAGLEITPVWYNFTATINSTWKGIDLQETVNISAPILFQKFYTEINIICNVSSIIFHILDTDGGAVESGWILVSNGTNKIHNLTINEDGEAKFYWLNSTGSIYNYTIYYHDNDYSDWSTGFELHTVILDSGPILNTELEGMGYKNIHTNLTTIIFDCYKASDYSKLGGATLVLRENETDNLIVNLFTHLIDGNITYRWVNSSQIGDAGNRNVSIEVNWGGYKAFNMTDVVLGVPKPTIKIADFTIKGKKTYKLYVIANEGDYATELVSLNPKSSYYVDWGTQLTIRYFFNSTKNPDPDNLGPIDTNYMTINVKTTIGDLVRTFPMYVEVSGSGIHQGTIDTGLLDIKSYIIEVTAISIGYIPPPPETLGLEVKKNNAILNQSEHDDSVKTAFWLENINMTTQPYGENTEMLIIMNSIYNDVSNNYMNHSFQFSIPDLNSDWNLSFIRFNLYNATFTVGSGAVKINITDPYGESHIFDHTHPGHDAYPWFPNGSWTDLIIPLNKRSITNDNLFEFKINGTFYGDFDLIVETMFLRDKINTQYSLFNISDYISIPDDSYGWAIKNITFLLYNCRNPSDWSPILNPTEAISQIRTNDGYNYTLTDPVPNDGKARLSIDNITIYPLESHFLFDIINVIDIMFDINITIEYIQGFYRNQHLEITNITKRVNQFTNGGDLSVNPYDNEFLNDYVTLRISDIIGDGTSYEATDIGMNITIGGEVFSIGELQEFSLEDYPTNLLYNAYILTNTPVNFTLEFVSKNSRTVYYKVFGDITYVATSTVYGPVDTYDTDLECYLLILDTSDLNAQAYTIVFTYSSDYYETTTKNLNIDVLERITLLNGREDLVTTIGITIYVQDAINFTFSYIDRDLNNNITDLKTQSYTWTRFSNGVEVDDGSGTLTINANKKYVLDFNTETKQVGRYDLIVKLDKYNYEIKIATITLTIEKREIDYDLGSMFDGKQVSVVKGKTITIEIELTDPTRGDKAIKGAKVVLEIGDDELEFDEKDDGVYELKFDTEDYEAFFTSNILTGTIKISKSNYTSEEVDITIVIQMEEIIEGVPTFYFIMVVGAVAAVVGSLATYRLIQLAKIPKFIKKARAMKKAIKGRGEIPNSALTSSKEEMILKQFGNEWKELGLSLEDTLGIKGKKGKPLSNEEGGAK